MAKGKTLELSIKIAGKMDKSLTAALNGAQSQLTGLATNIGKIGTAGLAAMGALATGALTAIDSCADKAAEHTNYMADVVKYVDGLADETGKINTKNYEAMSDAILDLSTQIPYTIEELAALSGAAGEAGKNMEQIFHIDSDGNVAGFLKNVAMAGSAMDISADQAGAWAAKWETAFTKVDESGKRVSFTHEDVMVLFDQINHLAANGAASAAEIGEIVNTSGSLGGIAGMSPAAVAALGNAMLSMGSDASTAATSINRMMTNMTKGDNATKAQKEAWLSLGMTARGVAADMQEDAAGTIIKVLEAINNLDADKQVATLNTLFGQWAIKDAAKIAGNLDVYINSLDMVNDPAKYTGSMEREFLIKATTPEAVDTMLQNSMDALQIELGTAFLPAKKEFGLAMIDFMNLLRGNMPQLQQLAQTLGTLASKGVTELGKAMNDALPHIQKGLDYLVNNGDQVVSVLKKVAVAFALMQTAPAAVGLAQGAGNLLTGVGGLLFGTDSATGTGGANAGGRNTSGGQSRRGGLVGGIVNLFKSGQNMAADVGTVLNIGLDGVAMYKTTEDGGKADGLLQRLITGAAAMFSGAKNIGGINSGKANETAKAWSNVTQSTNAAREWYSNVANAGSNFFSTIFERRENRTQSVMSSAGDLLSNLFAPAKNAALKTGTGQWTANVAQSVGAVGQTTIGSKVVGATKATGGAVLEILSGISGATGLTDLKNNAVGLGKSGAGWLGGKLGSVAAAAKQSKLGMFVSKIGGAAGAVGQLMGAGGGVMASAWVPVMGGFGSLLSGALPVVAAISGIIAVVSILGDNLEGIRNIVGSVFGEQGLAVFDTFTGGLKQVGDYIKGLFAKDGVATALEPLRDGIANLFGPDAAAAFDGITTILQSVMGVIEQLVNFSTGTVKPNIESLFSFIVQTVIPGILQVVTAAAPYIAQIVSGVGTAVMTCAQIIGTAIQFAWPFIEWLGSALLNVGQVVIPAVLAYFGKFAEGLAAAVSGAKTIFEGLLTFLTGVFTGDWSKVWEGARSIFVGTFETLGALFKTPINAVITLINKAISGINNLGLTIPEWVPGLGGKSFAINIPEIPMLAKGGFTKGVSIAGEAGTEAVISFQRNVRRENVNTWLRAGEMLGLNPMEFFGGTATTTPSAWQSSHDVEHLTIPEWVPVLGGKSFVINIPEIPMLTGGAGNYREIAQFPSMRRERRAEIADIPNEPNSEGDGFGGGITFAPQITIQGNADRSVVEDALAQAQAQFEAWYLKMQKRNARTAY